MTAPSAAPGGEVVLYEAGDGELRLEVRLERESVWLPLTGIAQLFGRDKSVISRHVRNVFASGELERDSAVAKNATTAADGKTYQVEYFNLDAILSVGYRVNSKRGTQFRIWATRTLHEHLVRGFTLNERRLRERGLGDIEQSLALVSRTLERNALATSEGRAVLDVVRHYARTWQLLLAYDEDRLAGAPSGSQPPLARFGLSMRAPRSRCFARSSRRSARPPTCSAASVVINSTGSWPRSSRPSAASRSTRASKRARRTSSTS